MLAIHLKVLYDLRLHIDEFIQQQKYFNFHVIPACNHTGRSSENMPYFDKSISNVANII